MYQLVADVLDHAPADLTSAEVVVLVTIAEDARTTNDPREIHTEDLCRRTRLEPSGLRKAVRRLAARGIEVRVAIGRDKHGKPLYAVPGVAPRWKLPTFEAPAGCSCRPCRKGGPTGPPSAKPQVSEEVPQDPLAAKGVPQDRLPVPQDRLPVPQDRLPVPQDPPIRSVAVPVINQRPATVAYVCDTAGADEDEARRVITTIKTRHKPRSIGAYVRAMPHEDLLELFDEVCRTAPPTRPPMPDKCDRCDPNRLVELPGGAMARCPQCHPGAPRAATRTA